MFSNTGGRLFKVIMFKISVLADLATPVVTDGNRRCGLMLKNLLGSKTKYCFFTKENSVSNSDLICGAHNLSL